MGDTASLSFVLGLAGAVLILVGLVGGGFTFSGSVMPSVGKAARIPCLGIGGVLVVVAVGLVVYQSPQSAVSTITPAPAAPTPAPTLAPIPTNAEPAKTLVPASPPVVVGTGTVILDTYVFEYPALAAPVVGQMPVGTPVEIYCTAQGEVVTRYADGVSSSLWNFVGTGFVPDIAIDTGTAQAVAGSC